MTPVERAARALCKASWEGHDPDELVTHKPPPNEEAFEREVADNGWGDDEYYFKPEDGDEYVYSWKRWRSYEDQVRAVIAALREPSEAMIEEGAGVIPCAQGAEEGPMNHDGSRGCWQAMIDAMLAEKPATD